MGLIVHRQNKLIPEWIYNPLTHRDEQVKVQWRIVHLREKCRNAGCDTIIEWTRHYKDGEGKVNSPRVRQRECCGCLAGRINRARMVTQ